MKQAILLLLLLSPWAVADSLNLMVGCWSYHTDRDSDYNETNKCLGLQYAGYTALYFKNSEGGDSFAVAKNYEYPWTEHLSYGFKVGAVTGYQRADVLPTVLPYVSTHFGQWSLDFHAIPTVVYTVGIRFELDL